jgi:hypothetical protein
MKTDCRNDCFEPAVFPKKIHNRPGLPHINYRIGTYSDFREALLRNLNRNALLAGWTHRCPDDPGIALLEGASVLGDILTFYQELYANEVYLRTAQWRESIADLVKLLGYRLSPGLGGKATFAFEVKGDKPVIIPKGFPVKAQLEGLEQPAEFEIVEETIAYPALSKFNLYRPFHFPNITTGSSGFSVETSVLRNAGITLNEGDRLMLVASPSDPATQNQIAVVAKTSERFDRTEITIDGSWQGGWAGAQISAYKLGRSFRYFGYNTPPKETLIVNNEVVQNDVSFSTRVGLPHGMYMAYLHGTYYPLPNLNSFPLDQQAEDISVGSALLVTLRLSADASGIGGYHFFERKITKVTSATLTIGSLTGGATVLELNSVVALPSATPPLLFTDIRTVDFHEVIGPKLTLKSAIEPSVTSDKTRLYYFGDAISYQKLHHRSVQIVRNSQVEQAVLTIDSSSLLSSTGPALRPLTLNPQLQVFTHDDFPLDEPKIHIYGNLADATQGKTEKEAVLGNGDNRQTFQTFKLPKAPLTYHNSAGETPPEVPELQIYVNDRLWKRVPSFFGRGAKEEIYIVREDVNGDSWVQFGDGKTGARLSSGLKNVIARYRTGTGAHGAVKEGATAQADGKLDRLDKIQLPGVASGGSEPETGDNAREAAPGKIQSLDRLVSLKDFETEALAISGVSKASAAWELKDNVPAVVMTVLMETGRDKEISEVRYILNNYNKCRGSQRFPVIVYQGKLRYVYVDIVFSPDPSFREKLVRKAIKEALGVADEEGNDIDGLRGLFGLSKRRFGEREYASRIEGIVQNVKGVVWVKVKALGLLEESEDPSKLSLPSEPKPLKPVVSCDSLSILSLYKDHIQLSVSKTESKEVC